MSSPTQFSGRRVTLSGSEREPFASSTTQLAAPEADFANQQITVSVVVKRKAPLDVTPFAEGGVRLSREQLEDLYGPDANSLSLVSAFAEANDLTVADAMPGTRTVHLTGTVAAMQTAFGTELRQVQSGAATFHVRQGSISLPVELETHVQAVLGLDSRPQAQPHSRRVEAHTTGVSYTPVQVGQAYNFPKNKATGQTIGIIELGGGYSLPDLQTYFQSLGLPTPAMTAVLIDGATNHPGTDPNSDGEVMLDIEVAGAVAQGAKIAVYFAPNTDQGFLDAIVAAVHDKVNKPDVISISWGSAEKNWTRQSMLAFDSAFQSAVALGITVTAATGDNGSPDAVNDGANHADFPASSPHVLACGGTSLHATGATVQSEVVWNDLSSGHGATGGGVSSVFTVPSWQSGRKATSSQGVATALRYRGLPDVSANADPLTGYKVRVDGQNVVYGGTSAVAPLWAGLLATCYAQPPNQPAIKPVFVTPKLYVVNESDIFRDITSGNNGGFKATAAWDACTGLGSPNGLAIERLIRAQSAMHEDAATPQPKPDYIKA